MIFVNTGFLDRTGDEIHTCFAAGPVLRKGDMKSTVWLQTYEDRNVDVALEAGFEHHAQIGKGMWAKPAAMAEMLEQKIGQPKAGANTAWVPSPTAATLHALHYLRIDVHAVQEELSKRETADRRNLLELPLADPGALSDEDVRRELETNAQSILGYVVRWVGMGIGCSTVPDLDGRRADGGPRDAADLQPADRELARARRRRRRHRAGDVRAHGRAGRRAERGPGRLPADGARPREQRVVPGRPGAGLHRRAREPNGYTERPLTQWRRKAKARA